MTQSNEKLADVEKAITAFEKGIKYLHNVMRPKYEDMPFTAKEIVLIRNVLERAKADLSMDKLKADCSAAHKVFDTVDIGKSLEAGEVVRKADLSDVEGGWDEVTLMDVLLAGRLSDSFAYLSTNPVKDSEKLWAIQNIWAAAGRYVELVKLATLETEATPQANNEPVVYHGANPLPDVRPQANEYDFGKAHGGDDE